MVPPPAQPRPPAVDPAGATRHRGNMEVRHRSTATDPAWAARHRGEEIEVSLPICRCSTQTWTLGAEGDADTQGEHTCIDGRSQTGYHRDAVPAVPLTVRAHDHLRLIARSIPAEGIDLR
jgi:hypothetical protein